MLSDYAPEKADIEYRGKVLCTVRGLNSTDVATLLRNHVADLRMLFTSWDATRKLLPADDNDIEARVYSAIINAPATIVKTILIATGETDLDAASRLSMPLQMKIVLKVLELTFEDVGGPLGFAVLLRTIVLTTSSQPSDPTQSSQRTIQ